MVSEPKKGDDRPGVDDFAKGLMYRHHHPTLFLLRYHTLASSYVLTTTLGSVMMSIHLGKRKRGAQSLGAATHHLHQDTALDLVLVTVPIYFFFLWQAIELGFRDQVLDPYNSSS